MKNHLDILEQKMQYLKFKTITKWAEQQNVDGRGELATLKVD